MTKASIKTTTRTPNVAASRKLAAGTKQDRVLAMLHAKTGATVAAIIKATSWQEHTVRAFFSAVVRKRLGLTMVMEKNGDERVYRIVAAKPTRRTRPAQGK